MSNKNKAKNNKKEGRVLPTRYGNQPSGSGNL